MVYRLSLYAPSPSLPSLLVDRAGRPLELAAYSRAKRGHFPEFNALGQALAEQVILDYQELLEDERPITVISAPYVCLQTASEDIATAFVRRITEHRVFRRLSPAKLGHLRKAKVGDARYARADTDEEREKLLAGLDLSIDAKLIDGCIVFVIDDIRVTGKAEELTAALLATLNPAAVAYLHGAVIDLSAGKTTASVESAMNESFDLRLIDILGWEMKGEFHLNTRVLRFILNRRPTRGDITLSYFLQDCPTSLLWQMYDGTIGGGIGYVAELDYGFRQLQTELFQRGHVTQPIDVSQEVPCPAV